MTEAICTICQGVEPLHGEAVTALPCGHVFHSQCLDNYCFSKGEVVAYIPCPVCKFNPRHPHPVVVEAHRNCIALYDRRLIILNSAGPLQKAKAGSRCKFQQKGW